MHHFGTRRQQAAAAVLHDGLQILDGLLELIVDDDVVEFAPMAQIFGRIAQAPLE